MLLIGGPWKLVLIFLNFLPRKLFLGFPLSRKIGFYFYSLGGLIWPINLLFFSLTKVTGHLSFLNFLSRGTPFSLLLLRFLFLLLLKLLFQVLLWLVRNYLVKTASFFHSGRCQSLTLTLLHLRSLSLRLLSWLICGAFEFLGFTACSSSSRVQLLSIFMLLLMWSHFDALFFFGKSCWFVSLGDWLLSAFLT